MKPEEVDLNLYVEGMSSLVRSGIFSLIRERGKVRGVNPNHPHYAEAHIAEANRSIGYLQAIDDILKFKDGLTEPRNNQIPMPDYGGIKDLLSKKAITEKEADDLRAELAKSFK